MVQVDTLFCLFADAPPGAVLRHVIRLAGSLDAAVCVLRREKTPEAALARLSRKRRQVRTARPVGLEGQSVSEDPIQAARRIRAHTEKKSGAGLLMTFSGTGPKRKRSRAASLFGTPFVEDLACRADVPVYALCGGPPDDDAQRLLVPTDLSNSTPRALEHAALLATVYGASIALLHVITKSPYVALTPADRLSLKGPTLAERQARHRLRTVVRTSQLLDVPVRIHLRFGEPVDEIVPFARQGDVGAVVLPVRGRDPASEPLFGPVAEQVLRRVECPFLLVPPCRKTPTTA